MNLIYKFRLPGASGANEMEACAVSRLARALAGGARARGLSLAVLTPYAAHRDLVRRHLRHLGQLDGSVSDCPHNYSN